MDGSGDRLLQDDVFVRGGYEVPGAHQSIHIFAFRDASQSTRSGNINSQNAIYVGDLEAAVDDFDISEFFDLQNAALDPDDAHPSPSEPQLTTATTTNTLRSTGSEDILRSPSGDPTQCSRHVMLDGSGGGRESNIAKTTSTLLSPLWHWPIDHITIQIQPRPNNAFITVPNDRDAQLSWNMKRKASQEDITGNPCFNPNVGPGSTKKRKKLTAEQLESARSIRAQGGACLRCYVQKQKCSEGRPCGGCQKLFNKAYGSKTLQWTACISSNLPDINIFALGISLSADGFHGLTPPANRGDFELKLDANKASALYKALLDIGYISGILSIFDAQYTEVLRYIYGQRASEVHPFILQDRTPLHMLIQLNVILLGSPIIGHKLIGYVRYLQTLRAICGVVAFECLGKALDRTALQESTPVRQLSLILQAALLLDQVVEMHEQVPAAGICFAQVKTYGDMQKHLVQYISYYLEKLIKSAFGKGCEVLKRLQRTKCGDFLDDPFWHMLSDLIPAVPLRKPPKLRTYADMSWGTHHTGVDLGELYGKLFSPWRPIPCY